MRFVVVSRLVRVEFCLEKVAVDHGAFGIARCLFGERPHDFQFEVDIAIVPTINRDAISDSLVEFFQSSFANDHTIADFFHPFDGIDHRPCFLIG